MELREGLSLFFKLLKDWTGQKAGTQLSMSDADGDILVKAGGRKGSGVN